MKGSGPGICDAVCGYHSIDAFEFDPRGIREQPKTRAENPKKTSRNDPSLLLASKPIHLLMTNNQREIPQPIVSWNDEEEAARTKAIEHFSRRTGARILVAGAIVSERPKREGP